MSDKPFLDRHGWVDTEVIEVIMDNIEATGRRIIVEQLDNGYTLCIQEWNEEEYYSETRLVYKNWEEVVEVATHFLGKVFCEGSCEGIERQV